MIGMNPAILSRIREHQRAGKNRADTVRALSEEYPKASRRTLYRWVGTVLASGPAPAVVKNSAHRDDVDAARSDSVSDLSAGPAPVPLDVDADAAAVLEQDDLGELERVRRVLSHALRSWEGSLASDRSASLTYQRLAKTLGDIVARIVELRPRPEQEADRLAALGAGARDALLARAREAARPDEVTALRQRVSAQAVVIERLTNGPR